MNRIDGSLAAPTFTSLLAAHRSALRGNGFGQLLGQVKIAADALTVGAIETKDRFGVREVHCVLDLAGLGRAFCIVETEVHGQGFQFREAGGETERILDALAFQFTVFETGACSLSIHGV